MRSITSSLAWIAAAALLGLAPNPARAASGSAAPRPSETGGAGNAARGQQTPPAKPAQQPAPAGAQGTGIVPPGVKLAPQMPPPGPVEPFHFPAVASKTLANGLRVFVASDHRQPAVSVELVLTTAGTIRDPANLPGLASMAASLLTQGTKTRSAQQIAQAIDFVGGSLSASAELDDTTASVTVVKKDFPLGMDLLSDVVLHPSFPPEEIARIRQETLSELRVAYEDAGYVATQGFARIVYGASPYGAPGDGTPESVPRITRDDLVHFWSANFAPNHALLAFAGDVTPAEAFAAAEKYFGGWAEQTVPKLEAAPPPAVHGVRLFVIDKPDAVQTQIRVGRRGIPRNSPDYIPLFVTNRIFGGGYNSRLNTEVRVEKGLTYGAQSSFQSNRFAGSFVAATFTRTEATGEATQLVVKLIAQMATGEIRPEELRFAEDYLAGVYPIQTETAEQVASRVLAVAEYGLPADYNQTYQERVRAVTLAEAEQMARRYFDARDLDLVLVGNAAQFRDALKKAFPGAQYEEIPLDQLDLLSPTLIQPAKK
jgi:zinc protease